LNFLTRIFADLTSIFKLCNQIDNPQNPSPSPNE
jgi:hypothetical protein